MSWRATQRCAATVAMFVAATVAAAAPADQPRPSADADGESSPAAPDAATEFGFRHDPLDFIAGDQSVQGALVRTRVLRADEPADRAIVERWIDQRLADQRSDGTFGDTAALGARRVIELLDLGCAPTHPRLRRAAGALLRQVRSGRRDAAGAPPRAALSADAIEALCRLGRAGEPEVAPSLRWLLEHPGLYLGSDVPGPRSAASGLRALWAGREVAGTKSAVADGLGWIARHLNGAGCLAGNDPWELLEVAGLVDLDAAGAIVDRLVPLILRAQHGDGGWGPRSFVVLRALRRHGLFEPLRARPPLPADWRMVRCIPAPPGRVYSLTWDGSRLWVYDRDGGRAIAVSRDDGRIEQTVSIPGPSVHGIAMWDDALAVVQRQPARVLQVDPRSGRVRRTVDLPPASQPLCVAQVGGRLYVGDRHATPGLVLDPGSPHSARSLAGLLAGPCPLGFAPTGATVWHVDQFAPAVLESDLKGQLVDWAEKPFGAALEGLAWDGLQLWALDGEHQRICAVRRAGPADAADDAGCIPCDSHYEVIRVEP